MILLRKIPVHYYLIAILFALFILFLGLPVLSLILYITPEQFIAAFSDDGVRQAIILSFMTATISTCLVILFGIPIAYMNARHEYRGKNWIETLLDLPIVLPPSVAGLALLLTFGRNGMIGSFLYAHGIHVIFTTLAVIIAQIFVACPFFIRQARTAFEGVRPEYEQAARTLGAGRIAAFMLVTFPLARAGLISGAILSFARAIGEFGATIMVAGNLPGRTQTMPLAIYSMMQSDLSNAVALSVILVIFSAFVLMMVRVITRSGTGS